MRVAEESSRRLAIEGGMVAKRQVAGLSEGGATVIVSGLKPGSEVGWFPPPSRRRKSRRWGWSDGGREMVEQDVKCF